MEWYTVFTVRVRIVRTSPQLTTKHFCGDNKALAVATGHNAKLYCLGFDLGLRRCIGVVIRRLVWSLAQYCLFFYVFMFNDHCFFSTKILQSMALYLALEFMALLTTPSLCQQCRIFHRLVVYYTSECGVVIRSVAPVCLSVCLSVIYSVCLFQALTFGSLT